MLADVATHTHTELGFWSHALPFTRGARIHGARVEVVSVDVARSLRAAEPPSRRRADLLIWVSTLMPLAAALQVLLGMLRDSGKPQKVVTTGGQFQQSLPPGRVYQLMRVRLDTDEELIPEISGHRLMVMVRMMKQDPEGRLRPTTDDTSFELSLCS